MDSEEELQSISPSSSIGYDNQKSAAEMLQSAVDFSSGKVSFPKYLLEDDAKTLSFIAKAQQYHERYILQKTPPKKSEAPRYMREDIDQPDPSSKEIEETDGKDVDFAWRENLPSMVSISIIDAEPPREFLKRKRGALLIEPHYDDPLIEEGPAVYRNIYPQQDIPIFEELQNAKNLPLLSKDMPSLDLTKPAKISRLEGKVFLVQTHEGFDTPAIVELPSAGFELSHKACERSMPHIKIPRHSRAKPIFKLVSQDVFSRALGDELSQLKGYYSSCDDEREDFDSDAYCEIVEHLSKGIQRLHPDSDNFEECYDDLTQALHNVIKDTPEEFFHTSTDATAMHLAKALKGKPFCTSSRIDFLLDHCEKMCTNPEKDEKEITSFAADLSDSIHLQDPAVRDAEHIHRVQAICDGLNNDSLKQELKQALQIGSSESLYATFGSSIHLDYHDECFKDAPFRDALAAADHFTITHKMDENHKEFFEILHISPSYALPKNHDIFRNVDFPKSLDENGEFIITTIAKSENGSHEYRIEPDGEENISPGYTLITSNKSLINAIQDLDDVPFPSVTTEVHSQRDQELYNTLAARIEQPDALRFTPAEIHEYKPIPPDPNPQDAPEQETESTNDQDDGSLQEIPHARHGYVSEVRGKIFRANIPPFSNMFVDRVAVLGQGLERFRVGALPLSATNEQEAAYSLRLLHDPKATYDAQTPLPIRKSAWKEVDQEPLVISKSDSRYELISAAFAGKDRAAPPEKPDRSPREDEFPERIKRRKTDLQDAPGSSYHYNLPDSPGAGSSGKTAGRT